MFYSKTFRKLQNTFLEILYELTRKVQADWLNKL